MQIKQFKAFILPVALLLASCSENQRKFTVSGHLDNMPVQTVYLEELNVNDIVILDSSTTKENGDFELTGKNAEIGLYRLRFQYNKFMLLSIDKGLVKLVGNWSDIEKSKVEGSPSSSSLLNFLDEVRNNMRDFNTLGIVLDSMKARGDDSALAIAKDQVVQKNISFTRFIEQYADTTQFLPNAIFAVRMLNPAVEKDYINVFVQNLGARFHNAKLAKDYIAKYNEANSNKVQAQGNSSITEGSMAPEISLPTVSGEQVMLSSFKGKYVLVDFWASWCRPCRMENPNVVAAYNKYKDKNFTVLGVSLDDDKDKWQEAIAKDGLTWTHISDLKGWESVAARTYGIESIPSNVLVGPDGKVIARDLRGEALEEKLAEVVK